MENQPLNLNESSIPFDNTSVLNDTTILNLNHDLSQIKFTDFQIPDDILDEFSIQILKDIANNSFEDKNTFEGVEYKKEMINLFKMLLDKNPKMKKISEHINDKNYSPRTLKVVTNEKGTRLCGIVEVL